MPKGAVVRSLTMRGVAVLPGEGFPELVDLRGAPREFAVLHDA